MSTIKIRANMDGDLAKVRVLITHPMETGLRKDKKTGKAIPAHFIQEVKCEHNGKNIMTANWGTSISTNPYFSFFLKGAKAGDKLMISWHDNTGSSDSSEVSVR